MRNRYVAPDKITPYFLRMLILHNGEQPHKENSMRKKKVLMVCMLLVLTVSGSLFAANTFSVAGVGYYTYTDLSEGNYETFIPGVRAEFYLSDFLGVSGDAIFRPSADYEDVYYSTYIVDLVFRLPLGLIDAYVATGPAYSGIVIGKTFDVDESAFAYNVRGGIDVNLSESFSIGAEADFLVEDVPTFIRGIADLTNAQLIQVMETYSTIGISGKFKF